MPDSLEQIAAEVAVCTRCPLHRGRTKAVPGEGSPNADIMFIGEGPGYHEDRQGRPFVGASGSFLTEMLEGI
ncbi:MAG TPA: uracil-DNA glycosylase family protein, partial [Aggregatilineales bacterium]|nr:uracil-DNA glycosylase family protein [Aggregatilineales bacterium]